MRADDFVRTGTDAAQAAADMAANHTTDAVSSGIVGSADKSGLQLKEQLVGDRNSGLGNGWPPEGSNLGGLGSGNIDPNMTDYAGQAANVQVGAMHDDVSSAAVYGSKAEREASRLVNSGTAASRAASMLKQTGGKVAADRLVSSKPGGQKLFSKANLKKAAKGAAISEALSGSEFEDIDSYYYKAKGTYNLAKKGYTKAKSALEKRAAKKAAKAGKDVSGGASKAKKVAEKKTKEKTAKQAQKAAQSARNQRRAISAAKEAQAAGAAKAATAAESAGAAASAGGGLGGILAGIGGMLLPVLGIVFGIVLIGAIAGAIYSLLFSSSVGSSNAFGPLFYWIQYETGSTDESAYDCVTLNDGAGGQAYGVQFDYRYDLQPFLKYCYNNNPQAYIMFAPYINCGTGELRCSSEDTGVAQAWHQAYSQNKNSFINAQQEFILQQTLNPKIDDLQAHGFDFTHRNDVCKGAVLSYIHQHGPGNLTASTLSNCGITNDTSDEEFLDKLYQHRIAVYGNWGGLQLWKRYNAELATAKAFLHGDGDVVQRAHDQLGKPYVWGAGGPDSFDCSGLVTYALTGSTDHRYNTTLIMAQYDFTKIDASEAQPGDIVCNWHHCGVYIGNGEMIHAPHTGDVVKISNVHSDMSYYRWNG